MKPLSDQSLLRLQQVAAWPDVDPARYEILGQLGQGGMGVVYLARDRELDREIALKVLPAGQSDPAAAGRMLREARVLARLEHPGIVPVHDVGLLADGRVYYTMKRVRGDVLDAVLTDGRPLVSMLRIFERICDAVSFAHAAGILHRDLKPSNVMVGSFGEVLVMDWGVAKLLEGDDTSARPSAPDTPLTSATTHPGTVLGTPGYMAPEQARGAQAQVDQRSDVYALGAILRDMIGNARERVPRPLLAVRDKALQAEPGARYPRVAELGADIARLLDGRSVSVYRPSPQERLGAFARRHRAAILLLGTYLVVRALLLAFLDV